MSEIEVSELAPGDYSLTLVAGVNPVDDVIDELGHEPNGEFWAGIVDLIIARDAPELAGRYEPDPEAGAFYATSDDREALDALATRLRSVAADEAAVRELVAYAESTGYEFDD